MAPRSAVPALLLALLLGLAACKDETVAPETGALSRVLLTDAPFPYDRLSRVDFYIVSVSASMSPDSGAGAGGFVTLASPQRRYDILSLQNGTTAELGSLALPTGAITAVRMVIDTDSSSVTLRDGRVLTGSTTPGIHWQSSAGRPVLNALVHEQLSVPDTGAVIVIDFDVSRSFTTVQEVDSASTDSGFIFMPQFRAADASRTGTVTGVVRARSASGAPVADAAVRLYLGVPTDPENTWPALQSAKTDANGAFRISYVTRSSWWATLPAWAGATYIVAVDPPRSSGLGRMLVPGVTVEPQQVVSVGTVVLP